jgi:16S rRNA (uracil1498-N3)-methyltransferase
LLADWPAARRLLLCAEGGPARPLAEVLTEAAEGAARRPAPRAEPWAEPWAVLTGPEGGFAASELDALAKLPFVTPVGLGPRVLRADTAALAALACWQAILGDGAGRPPRRRSEEL